MNKNLLKNSWFLVGLHLLITIIIGSILYLINKQLDIKFSNGAAAFLAAFIIGQIYTFKLKELINKKLRLRVSSIAVAIQFALGILLGLFSDFTGKDMIMYLVALIILRSCVKKRFFTLDLGE